MDNVIGREEIESALNHKGGMLTLWLKELEQTGFITRFTPWHRKYKTYYKITDESTLFYLTWIKPMVESGFNVGVKNRYWEEVAQTPAWRTWASYAFESVCYKHIENIRQALNISSGSLASSWRYIPPYRSKLLGTQIDLVFDRNDGFVNLCEIKHANGPYKIDKAYAAILENKRKIYQTVTHTKKQIVISMITTFGLQESDYANDIVFSSCTLNELFRQPQAE